MRFQTPVVHWIAFAATLAAFSAQAGNESPNGGEVFDSRMEGKGYQFFDFIEYGSPFFPTELPHYQEIERQLRGLERVAPVTASFLRHVFREGAVWYFVDPELKEVRTTGESQLLLGYEKVQLAVAAPVKRRILINRGLWDQLSEEAQRFVLVHEALWIAEKSPASFLYFNAGLRFFSEAPDPDQPVSIAFGHTQDEMGTQVNLLDISTTSESIRALTGLIMNPMLTRPESPPIGLLEGFIDGNAGLVNSKSWKWSTFGQVKVRMPILGWDLRPALTRYRVDLKAIPAFDLVHHRHRQRRAGLDVIVYREFPAGSLKIPELFDRSPLGAAIWIDSLPKVSEASPDPVSVDPILLGLRHQFRDALVLPESELIKRLPLGKPLYCRKMVAWADSLPVLSGSEDVIFQVCSGRLTYGFGKLSSVDPCRWNEPVHFTSQGMRVPFASVSSRYMRLTTAGAVIMEDTVKGGANLFQSIADPERMVDGYALCVKQ